MTAEFIVATHALVFLNHKRCSLSSEAIAENVCTNPARVRKVLAKLKRAGLIQAKAGVDGGYSFEGDPAAVTLADVFAAVGVSFVKIHWRSGDPDMECQVASGMGDIMDGVFAQVDESCKSTLQKTTILDIDRQLFSKNERGNSHEV